MVEIVKYLYNKSLAIIRESEDNNSELDLIFYLYKEMNEIELREKRLYEILNNGIGIIKIKDLLEETEKENKKLIVNISIESEKEYLLYNLFGYLLFIKLALREIQNITYSKGLTKIAYIVAKDEENIAYEFSQYLINEWNYNKGLEKKVLDIVNDRNKFIEYYKIFKQKINIKDLDKAAIYEAYDDLKGEFDE